MNDDSRTTPSDPPAHVPAEPAEPEDDPPPDPSDDGWVEV